MKVLTGQFWFHVEIKKYDICNSYNERIIFSYPLSIRYCVNTNIHQAVTFPYNSILLGWGRVGMEERGGGKGGICQTIKVGTFIAYLNNLLCGPKNVCKLHFIQHFFAYYLLVWHTNIRFMMLQIQYITTI